jgi:putative two-component system response regulator
VSDRPYKKPFPHKEAVAIICAGKGTQFDPVLVDLFFSVADAFDQAASQGKADPAGSPRTQ